MDKWLKALQTVPTSIRTGYALMALVFLLAALLASIGKLTPDHVFYLSLAMLAVALLGVILLKGSDTQNNEDIDPNENRILGTKLTTFADNANRPIYLVDDQFVVRYCNDPFLNFIGARREHIIGKRVETIVDLFEKIVPEERRDAFRKRQTNVLKKAKNPPYASISEVVDLSNHTSEDL